MHQLNLEIFWFFPFSKNIERFKVVFFRRYHYIKNTQTTFGLDFIFLNL